MDAKIVFTKQISCNIIQFFLGLWAGYNFQLWKSLLYLGRASSRRRDSRNIKEKCVESYCCSGPSTGGKWWWFSLWVVNYYVPSRSHSVIAKPTLEVDCCCLASPYNIIL